ncbi:uncharacterized protein LOC134185316 [Corticium candelabrum]|uniref:uncharacterized protein LOC134185316 n=1 Tax=Corticium candelabrum TaxID=121492 RepID=UPI002E25F95B|nr:uncharacterized protein LOC134185316 [Corticium candelabrum]
MLKRTTKGHKMEDTCLGPYRVIEMTASGGCVLRCIKTNSTMKCKVNISQLKIYNTPQKSFELANATSKDDESAATRIKGNSKPNFSDLERQLFDQSLLRLWYTGAIWEAWRAEEDDKRELAEHTSSVEECWLSVNVDVALWLDCRTYEKKPTLKRVSDFVLVNPVGHQEFNDFAKAEITPELQLLLDVDLIDMRKLYNSKGRSLFEVNKRASMPQTLSSLTSAAESSQRWVHGLDLNETDKCIIQGKCADGFLTNKHMHAAHQLLLKQFSYISGLESTLLCQTYGFAHVTSDGMK